MIKKKLGEVAIVMNASLDQVAVAKEAEVCISSYIVNGRELAITLKELV